MTGTVRWFEPKKGYGFIESDDGAGDVYVHYGCMVRTADVATPGAVSIVKPLEPGEKVEFEIVQAPYGRQATQVRRGSAGPSGPLPCGGNSPGPDATRKPE